MKSALQNSNLSLKKAAALAAVFISVACDRGVVEPEVLNKSVDGAPARTSASATVATATIGKTESVVQSEDGIRRARPNPNFLEQRREIVSGVIKANGRCVLERTYTVEAGEKHGERVMEFDKRACTYTIAVGRWLKLPEQTSQHSSANLTVSPRGSGPSFADVADAFGITTIWQQLWYEDPLGIDVNRDKVTVPVQNQGGCVSDQGAQGDFYWLSGTGWDMTDSSVVRNTNTCSTLEYESSSRYVNGTFCFWDPIDTIVTYFYNRARRVYPSTAQFSYSHDAEGGCQDWLEFDVDSSNS